MITINYQGRLGNKMFQDAAAEIFIRKNHIFLGDGWYENTIEINDGNFLEWLSKDSIPQANYHFNGFFQIKEFILKYRNELTAMYIKEHQPIDKDDVFVHYRLGDATNLRFSLPIDYYRHALGKLRCYNQDLKGYISTDSPDNPNVRLLMEEFNLKLYQGTPMSTIHFGASFNNLVLSEGSFSFWIGLLSNADTVYCNKREYMWHGNMFVIPEWIKLNYDK